MIDFTTVKNLATKFTVTGAQKAHIDRLVFELGILEKSVSALSQKLIGAEVKIAELTAENKELHVKLAHYEQRDEGLNEKEEQILRFFFESARELSAEDVVNELGFAKGEVDHFVGVLLGREFLVRTRPGITGGPRGDTPPMYRIDHLGSSYKIKKG